VVGWGSLQDLRGTQYEVRAARTARSAIEADALRAGVRGTIGGWGLIFPAMH
jgi:hypothetical protein